MKYFYKLLPAFAITLLGASIVTASTFYPTGATTYRLVSSIGSADTTIRLSNFVEPVSGIPYTMTYLNSSVEYATIDPQTTKSEFVSFTGITQNANGSATLTGVSRGLSRSYPYTASTTLRQTHSGQAAFILSDAPQVFYEYAAKRNDEHITGQWTFDSFPITPANNPCSETVAGVCELATGAEAAASTLSGSVGRLSLPTAISTSTWNFLTAANVIPVTDVTSKRIDGLFIATSTGSNPLFATSSISNGPIGAVGKNIQVFSSTGTTTFTVPTGVTRFEVEVQAAGAGGGSATNDAVCGGGGGGYAYESLNLSGTTSVQVFVGTGGAATVAGQWSTFGTNGFYLSASGGALGPSASPCNGGTGGIGSGGDLNIQGSSGGAADPVTNAFVSGYGGASRLGGSVSGVTNSAGLAGVAYGGGGSGFSASSGSGAGGAGANGVVIVRW